MNEPLWVTKRDALTIHEIQLAEHGGLTGIRDEGLLESALARPENLFAYGDPDLCDLAAAYAYGLAKTIPSRTATNVLRWVSASPSWT